MDYMKRVERRHAQSESPLETSRDREAIQRGISGFEGRYGPFDAVEVEDHGEVGWKLVGHREGEPTLFCAVPRPLVVRRIGA